MFDVDVRRTGSSAGRHETRRHRDSGEAAEDRKVASPTISLDGSRVFDTLTVRWIDRAGDGPLLKGEETPMHGAQYFSRLVASVARIAGHAYFPGKGEAVDQCLEDIEGLVIEGRISVEQRDVLLEILQGSFSHAA